MSRSEQGCATPLLYLQSESYLWLASFHLSNTRLKDISVSFIRRFRLDSHTSHWVTVLRDRLAAKAAITRRVPPS
jgi:hypothetical protein